MTLNEWRDHLEILGPDLTRWPSRLAEEGLSLMQASTEAQDVFAEVSLAHDSEPPTAKPPAASSSRLRAP